MKQKLKMINVLALNLPQNKADKYNIGEIF